MNRFSSVHWRIAGSVFRLRGVGRDLRRRESAESSEPRGLHEPGCLSTLNYRAGEDDPTVRRYRPRAAWGHGETVFLCSPSSSAPPFELSGLTPGGTRADASPPGLLPAAGSNRGRAARGARRPSELLLLHLLERLQVFPPVGQQLVRRLAARVRVALGLLPVRRVSLLFGPSQFIPGGFPFRWSRILRRTLLLLLLLLGGSDLLRRTRVLLNGTGFLPLGSRLVELRRARFRLADGLERGGGRGLR
ncbi:hypothetical protein EYF80_035952 [Liparis tanakae]|uniref:Uncharacterized protein n=1 Tax=Liparis tanakae TaxID=230148 RepID=A0A4Z2GJX5_9TELE|nr:hypothetical protein EYF80_035952 [Liparis tanakae]